MLVLSRKIGEKIVIEGGIEVTLLSIDGSRVRIGIEAPRECSIARGELLPASAPPATTPVSSSARVVVERPSRPCAVECTA